MDARIRVVKSKLAALQEREGIYRNGPCVSETALMAFESAHEVQLPAPYRDFLIQVGDGGPGPWDGLLSLDRWHDALEDSPAYPAGILADPSPLSSSRDLAWDAEVAQGSIALCARITHTLTYTLLVVSGPARGRVCTVDCNEKRCLGWWSIGRVGRYADFLDWYEGWLDAELSSEPFDHRLLGSEELLLEAAHDLALDSGVRAASLDELARRRTLSPAGTTRVEELLTDASPTVRAMALKVACEHHLVSGTAMAHRVVEDAEPAVRETARHYVRGASLATQDVVTGRNPDRRFVLARRWDGAVLPGPHPVVSLRWEDQRLVIWIEAPYSADPTPRGPPGPCDRLWEHEVVELFLLGPDGSYTEMELGPHGHHLVLQLRGVRDVVGTDVDGSVPRIGYRATIQGDIWTGHAVIPRAILPDPVAFNLYAIAGSPREYRALAPVPGVAPDFHQPDAFLPWPL